MKSIAEWISFGEVSAERDELLSEYFYDNGVLQKLIDRDNQFLILGRKGAGKTAVFQHFGKNPEKYLSKGDVSISLVMQNYSWTVHELLQSSDKAPSLSYIQSWKYVIYLSAIKELSKLGNCPRKIKDVQKIVGRLYTSPSPSISELIGSKLLQLSRIRLPSGGIPLDLESGDSLNFEGGEVSFSEVKNDQSLQTRLNLNLERLVELFEDALKELRATETRVFISFDRVDEAWDRESLDSSKRMIAGLIGASEYITANFSGRLRPFVFLREDIFDSLSLNDKNKLRADCGQLLAWNAQSLSRVILRRVNYFAKKSGVESVDDLNELFDKSKMRQSRRPFDYMITRTMVRPRDIIRLFDLTKGDMIDRMNNPYDSEPVNSKHLECEAVYSAEPAYSEWLLAEIKDEWEAQYPMILSLLDAIQHNASTIISKSDLRKSLMSAGINPSSTDLVAYLRFLFDNSIIGFKPGNFQQWRFKCAYPSQGFVDAENFKVHDGLTRVLNLKEPRAG